MGLSKINSVIACSEFHIEISLRSVLTGFALLGLAWLGCDRVMSSLMVRISKINLIVWVGLLLV